MPVRLCIHDTDGIRCQNVQSGGPLAPGYDACRELTDEHFESVFFKNLYAANFKLINIYMVFG
jgi:hypothetical protein